MVLSVHTIKEEVANGRIVIKDDTPFILYHGKLVPAHTLEHFEVPVDPVTLYYGMAIGQPSYRWLPTPADSVYGSSVLGSKYQGQSAATASRMHRKFPLRTESQYA